MKRNPYKINEKSIQHYRRTRYACVLYVVLFIAMIGFMMMQRELSYVEIIQQYPVLLAGFISCVFQGYLYFKINTYIKVPSSQKDARFIQIRIILDMCVEFCLLNFPAAILMLLGSFQTFQSNHTDLNTFLKEVKKFHLQKYIALYFSCSAGLLFSVYWILNAFS